MNCGGCVSIDKPFWGDSCPVKSCCEERNFKHCGQCNEFPCELLKQFAYDKEQGDDGLRIETCKGWSNYERHGIGFCELSKDDVITALEKESKIVLATCANNRVTIRIMSHVNDGLDVYFQTGEFYLKTQQIKANPNVAFSFGTYEIEGVAEVLGHPMDDSNRLFIEKCKVKHPNAVERWSNVPDQVVIKIKPKLARQWRYVDDKPVIALVRF